MLQAILAKGSDYLDLVIESGSVSTTCSAVARILLQELSGSPVMASFRIGPPRLRWSLLYRFVGLISWPMRMLCTMLNVMPRPWVWKILMLVGKPLALGPSDAYSASFVVTVLGLPHMRPRSRS
mmetsp:Transcript_4336/g.10934  ORF Transcript_4336/g.10934 Transcript_4336/m.10934 type:complete len:124 (+) Transcript_4336:423-794(+)